MRIYSYLYIKTLVNQVRKIVKKPTACIYMIFMILYFGWLAFTLDRLILDSSFGTEANLARVLCALTIYIAPANYASYAKRKGLAFLPGDVHFLFCGPTSPKSNLLYVYGKTLFVSLIMGLLVLIAGVRWFHIAPVRMLVYVIICNFLDSILQGALVVLLYGNERMSERMNRIFSWVMYGLIGCLVLAAAAVLYQNGLNFSSVWYFFDSDWIVMIPLIGWSLAVMRLIILGPSLVNVVCSVLYLISAVLIITLAWGMRCTGQYYEDAMKFADDYQEARKKSKKGEVAFIGKKKKYKTAQVTYRGSGARAIFYRQLLEYKKERFFIFGFVTLLYLAGGLFLGYLGIEDPTLAASGGRYYIIPGAMAYVSFIMCGYKTKWTKELESPYVFLIPEKPFLKMWYATLMDHIRSAVHAVLLTVPAMIGLRIEIWYLPVMILIQVCLQATSLYSNTVCNVIFGSVIGENMRKMLHMFLYLFAILIAVGAAAVATVFAGTWVGIGVAALYLAVLSGLMAWAGSRCFAKMES